MLDNLDEANFYLRMDKEDIEDERDYDMEAKDEMCETS